MFRHIVLSRFRADVTEEQKRAYVDALTALRTQVPELRGLTFGPDVGRGPNNFDFAMVADFDDRDAFKRYIDHPAHRELAAAGKAAVEKLAVVQHEH